MKFIKNIAIASIASLLSITAVQAGTFEAYSLMDQKSKRLVLVVSFAGGDDVTEAQADFTIPAGYKFVSAKSKVSDTLCVAIPDNKIRVVPPSGGTTPLPKAATDYCAFTFVAEKGLNSSVSPVFAQSFVECAAVSGIKSCNANIADITQ